ncbi:unnamed protein product [Mytilus edulis]|uniref:Uncharacterized protein n=1 Tax=Mytilus edulis TaxID=6550 RepID=A0A8S3SRC2_MYTED|nr:unnamed protein product [Mytilus edulis]
MSRKSLFGRKKSLDFTSACLQDSVIQKGNNTESSVVLCDEDSGLGMEETMQSTESPFLCSSFGGLLTIFDEDSHDTSLSEVFLFSIVFNCGQCAVYNCPRVQQTVCFRQQLLYLLFSQFVQIYQC